MPKILVLGGTTEASALVERLAERGLRTTLSYAGRTEKPRVQPVPVRIGGFGGVDGLTGYLRGQDVTHLIDATHPFAARMSANAVAAARLARVPHIALTRPPWEAAAGDRWQPVPCIDAAVATLVGPARNVMLALGRTHIDAFAAQPQHHYLLRFVDAPTAPPYLPRHSVVVDRGPFNVDSDIRLMRDHGIDVIVSKNAGGPGAQAKLIAARRLGLPVILIDRPVIPNRKITHSVEAVLDWIGHAADLGV